jgi:hypothetical protein
VHAVEIRPYAVLPTLALATFFLLQRLADLNFNFSLNKRLITSMFFVLVIWFHVYGILIFLSCLLFTLLSKCKDKDFKSYFKNCFYFASGILCFAMPIWLYSLFVEHSRANPDIRTFDFFPNPVHNPIGFLRGVIGNLIGFKAFYFLILGAFIPLIISYRERFKQLLFLFCCVVLPIGTIFIFDVIREYWFMQRQFIWVMPLFAFFLGWTWDSFFIWLRCYREKVK